MNPYVIAGETSERARTVFRSDVADKLRQLQTVWQNNLIHDSRQTIGRIAHGFKGNAAYFGLTALAEAATAVDLAIKTNARDERLHELGAEMIAILEQIMQANLDT